jgi:D-psicose/D-tagatose/L-ribulose 3-epimerase
LEVLDAVKFAICNEIFEGWALEDAFREIAEAGYEGVEIAPYTLGGPPENLSPRRRDEIRRALDDHGLGVTGLHWLLAHTEGMHVASDDPDTIHRTLQRLTRLADLCADLGGQVLVFGSPQQRSTPMGMTPPEALARATEMWGRWAERAKQLDVAICLEALPPEETDQLTTTAEVIDVVRTIDSPALGMVLDVKSMSSEPTPIPQLIASAAPYLLYVQANDANRGGPGFGETDFVPILQALDAAGYRGPISVEALDQITDPVDVAVRSLAYLRAAAQRAGTADR